MSLHLEWFWLCFSDHYLTLTDNIQAGTAGHLALRVRSLDREESRVLLVNLGDLQ